MKNMSDTDDAEYLESLWVMENGHGLFDDVKGEDVSLPPAKRGGDAEVGKSLVFSFPRKDKHEQPHEEVKGVNVSLPLAGEGNNVRFPVSCRFSSTMHCQRRWTPFCDTLAVIPAASSSTLLDAFLFSFPFSSCPPSHPDLCISLSNHLDSSG